MARTETGSGKGKLSGGERRRSGGTEEHREHGGPDLLPHKVGSPPRGKPLPHFTSDRTGLSCLTLNPGPGSSYDPPHALDGENPRMLQWAFPERTEETTDPQGGKRQGSDPGRGARARLRNTLGKHPGTEVERADGVPGTVWRWWESQNPRRRTFLEVFIGATCARSNRSCKD